MEVTARPARVGDLDELVRLYRLLEEEMVALKGMWRLADGLPEPLEEALRAALSDPDNLVYVGAIDGVPVGFALARSEPLLAQAGGERVGVIRLVFTEMEARGVGVAEVLRDAVVDALRRTGHSRFDAHVLPGHRLAKNFFEAGGFAARSIVMHHDDNA